MTQGEPPYTGAQPGAPPQLAARFPVWAIVLLSLVSMALVVVAILGALAYHGFTKFVRASKTAEAKLTIAQIAKDAAAAFEEREQVDAHGNVHRALCASASAPVPADPSKIRGVKWMSSSGDWLMDAKADAGFACLGFSLSGPQYYQYDYRASGSASLDRFRAIARGDIDGDGVLSTYVLEGQIEAGSVATISPSIMETDPDE